MNIKEHNDREIEIFKTIPPDKLPDFIEKNGARVREILENGIDEIDREEIENLKKWYLGL